MTPDTAVITTLNKCWMGHDGAWFFHCFRELGMETANRLNKAAISTLATQEVPRLAALVFKDPDVKIDSQDRFRDFFNRARELVVPDFMGIEFDLSQPGTMAWDTRGKGCFAHKGLQRMGGIETYECGVLFRIQAWLKVLEIAHTFSPAPGLCHFHHSGACNGRIEFTG